MNYFSVARLLQLCWVKRPAPGEAPSCNSRVSACTITNSALQFYFHGRTRIIYGSREAAGGHCPRDRRIRTFEKIRAEFHWALSISFGEDAFLFREPDEAVLLLFWMRCERRCF